MSSSGPHRLFRFLFTLAVVAGFPGAAAGGLAVGRGADEVGQAVAVGVDPNGVSGGDLRFSPRSGAMGITALLIERGKCGSSDRFPLLGP